MNFIKISIGCNIIGLLLLVGAVSLSPTRMIYDERDHFSVTKNMLKYGIIQSLTLTSHSAPGPLFSFIHILASPITKIKPPLIRFVNIAFLLGIIMVSAKMARNLNLSNPTLVALSILSVPFTYPIAGMALTEIPALFCFSIFMLFFLKIINQKDNDLMAVSNVIIGAIFAGLSIIGRQIYLLALLAISIVGNEIAKRWLIFFAVAAALLTSGWVFFIWGGITPPSLRSIGGLSLTHVLLSFGYFGFATLFIAPGWLRLTRSTIIISLLLLPLLMVIHFSPDPPAYPLAKILLSDKLLTIYQQLTTILMACFAIIWIYSLIVNGWGVKNDKSMLFIYSTLLLISITPLFISIQFSSRYVSSGIIPLILVLGEYIIPNPFTLIRYSLGIIIGIGSLLTYYH